MDTKWKRKRIKLSFLCYFVGFSLFVGSLAYIVWMWADEDFSVHSLLREVKESLSGDYQESEEFRNYISSTLRDFLGMAAEGSAQTYQESVQATIQGDKNLLYVIKNDRTVLRSNTRELSLLGNGWISKPDGYNFTLYFDGQKVSIVKNNRLLDVYGDGYYYEDSEWYVPGYINFPIDEKYKNVEIYMAVAEKPLLYTTVKYGSDGYQQLGDSLYRIYYRNRGYQIEIPLVLGLGGLGLLLLFLSLCMYKSRREARIRIAKATGNLWLEFKMLLWIFIISALLLSEEISRHSYPYWPYWQLKLWMIGRWMIVYWPLYFIINEFRCQGKEVWKNSLVAKLIHTFSVKELKMPLSRKIVRRGMLVFIMFELLAIITVSTLIVSGGWSPNFSYYSSSEKLLLIAVMGILVLTLVVVVVISNKNKETAQDLELLARRITEIRSGSSAEISAEEIAAVEPAHDLYQAVMELEDIRHGMGEAIEEQMKSERMKVELIANVSHDLKTPLTSIISYVQFLKQEEDLPEHVKDYIKILDEKSERLKNMVQDVFTVSKAASGELPVNIEVLDFGKLLRQTMADMEEEIGGSTVTFRANLPVEPVLIRADGQRLYRVFQNLFQNAIQYSLEGSRVHIELKKNGSTAVASVKNISQLELDENTNYAERFTRGDESRTDGGSGLGLSIAQSFTEACGGQFGLETIADLFVVTVSFPIVQPEIAEQLRTEENKTDENKIEEKIENDQ